MAIYLGSDTIDLRLGTYTQLLSAVYEHDLTNYWQKPEVYTKDQVLSCLDTLMDSIQRTYYSKDEISAMICGYEFEYGLYEVPERSGNVLLRNSVTNIMTPSADISATLPRTVINSNQLGREFYIRLVQPENAVSVSFLGYQGEVPQFMTEDGTQPMKMEGGGTYQYYFCEIRPSVFMVRLVKLVDYVQEPHQSVCSYYLVDGQQNALSVTEDSRLVFPSQTTDISGNMYPRDFTLYIQQSQTSARSVTFSGRDGETVLFEIGNTASFGTFEAGNSYFLGFSEVWRSGLSSGFVAYQNRVGTVSL